MWLCSFYFTYVQRKNKMIATDFKLIAVLYKYCAKTFFLNGILYRMYFRFWKCCTWYDSAVASHGHVFTNVITFQVFFFHFYHFKYYLHFVFVNMTAILNLTHVHHVLWNCTSVGALWRSQSPQGQIVLRLDINFHLSTYLRKLLTVLFYGFMY